MRKIVFLSVSLILVALVVSCSKEAIDDNGVTLKEATIDMQSLPVSDGGITPVILKVDKPKGGNVTCSDVAQAYFTSFDLCGEKLNYQDFNNDGIKEFDGIFPLNVTVEGVYVSFSTDGGNCIKIGEKYYAVGAVIVKGSNAANVYYYEEGTLSDSGLASPINASGSPAGLSNLTFCFVECEQPPLVIAIKTMYWEAGDYPSGSTVYGMSTGLIAFPTNPDWCGQGYLGYNNYPSTYSFSIEKAYTDTPIAQVTVGGGKVTVTALGGRTLDRTYVYIGTLSDLQTKNIDALGCPHYDFVPPWLVNHVDGAIHEFTPSL